MQPIQKFSDFQSKKNEAAQVIKEADLQKEYGEVFTSLLKKYGVTSPAELDDDKKKEFFNEIGDHYTAGEGATPEGDELVKKEGGEAPVKEEDSEGEEEKDEEDIINNVASLESKEEEAPEEVEEEKEEEKEVEEDAAEDIEKEKVEQGEPEKAEGEVETQPEEVEEAPVAEEDPEAGKAAELVPDEDTAKEIEKEKVEAGKPEKVVMDFDSFVKKMSVNEGISTDTMHERLGNKIVKEGIWPKSKLASTFQIRLAAEFKKNFKGIFYGVGNDIYYNDKKVLTVDGDRDNIDTILAKLDHLID